jgi:hypothetical protein
MKGRASCDLPYLVGVYDTGMQTPTHCIVEKANSFTVGESLMTSFDLGDR